MEISNIKVLIEKERKNTSTAKIICLNLNDEENFAWFIEIMTVVVEKIKENIKIAFGIFFSEKLNKTKLIKIKNIDILWKEKEFLLSLINGEDTKLYYESSILKNSYSGANNLIGIEMRAENLAEEIFTDVFKIEIIRKLNIGNRENWEIYKKKK